MASFQSLMFAIILYTLCFGPIGAHSHILRRHDDLSQRDTILSGLPDLSTVILQPSSSRSETSTTSVSTRESTSSSASTTGSSTHSHSATSAPTHSHSATSAPAPKSTSDGVRTSDEYKTVQPPDPLPFQPRITPAFGIGGVILILTGSVYAFVGIQHRLIYIFLSVAYLVSLSVTILILYVMNPPVPDATQCAYLVAIIATGAAFGGGAMFFPDLTEGFGCLLGGFSLSMWLLVLTPGGLLTSTTTITIFIIVFSAVIWLTAYIPFTKPYGLIVCLAFGGATVIVLGIDCFSRAGLKEFWLYIWRLNDNVFPLDTNSYPVTRGIKVEIAGVIFIAAIGILTQMKLWKFLKKRRDRRAAAKVDHRRALDREEEMVGRRVAWENAQSRQKWESVYGGGRNETETSLSADSGIGNMSAKEKKAGEITIQIHGIEMADLPSPTESGRNHTGGDPVETGGLRPTPRGSDRARRKSRDEEALAALEGGVKGSVSKQSSKSNRNSKSSEPQSPTLEVGKSSRRNSQRLSAGSRIMHRLSGHSLTSDKRLSTGSRILHRLSHNTSTSQKHLSRSPSTQGLRDEGGDFDCSSSTAATIDYLDSEADYEDLRSLPNGTPRASMVLDKVIGCGEGGEITHSPLDNSETKFGIESLSTEIPSLSSPLRESLLPHPPPKVATTFRTQEWTKHLTLAETPAALPINATTPHTPTTPTTPLSLAQHSFEASEAPSPVNVAALLQTAANGVVAPAAVRPKSAGASIQSKSPKRNRHAPALPTAVPRSNSMLSISTPQRAHRVSFNPAYGAEKLMESPTEDGVVPPRSSYIRPRTATSGGGRESLRMFSNAQGGDGASHAHVGTVFRQSSMPYLQVDASVRSRPVSAQQQKITLRHSTSRNSLGYREKGVSRLDLSDLEMIEARRSELLEDKARSMRARQEGEMRKKGVDGLWAEMNRSYGGEVHRKGLRRLMSEAKA